MVKWGVLIIEKNEAKGGIKKLVMKQARWVKLNIGVGRVPKYMMFGRKIRVRAVYGKMKAVGADLMVKDLRARGRMLVPSDTVSLLFESSYENKFEKTLPAGVKDLLVKLGLKLTDQVGLVGQKSPDLSGLGEQVGGEKWILAGDQKVGLKSAVVVFLDFSTKSSDEALQFLEVWGEKIRAKGVRIICVCKVGGDEMLVRIEGKRKALLGKQDWAV